jgi:GT2 family glycosyltransferase
MITTCILSYNHPHLTEKAVNSALVHVRPESLVLLHNGSEANHVQYLKQKFSSIQHLELAQNRGYSGGANQLLSTIFEKSDWVLFLTNDCQLLTAPQIPDEVGFYSPLIWSRHIGRVDSQIGVLDFKKGHLKHAKEEHSKLSSAQIHYVPGSAFIMHKEVFLKVGPFDESLGTYWEDVDFSIRAHKVGIPIKSFSKVQILHKIGKTCHKDNYYTTYLFQRNRRIVARRHCPPRFRIHLEAQLLWDTMRTCLFFAKKRKWDHLRLFQKAIADAKL